MVSVLPAGCGAVSGGHFGFGDQSCANSLSFCVRNVWEDKEEQNGLVFTADVVLYPRRIKTPWFARPGG